MPEDCAHWDCWNCGGGTLFLANHNFPGTHFPLLDQAIYHVGILASEVLNFTFVIDVKNQLVVMQ